MEMLSPERQLVSPFFLGGEQILVSYPTDAMTEDQKLTSLPGNNPLLRARDRVPRAHPRPLAPAVLRRAQPAHFGTPFYGEGNSLYWEMLLWDTGFTHTSEQRVGALLWRMHRCARA